MTIEDGKGCAGNRHRIELFVYHRDIEQIGADAESDHITFLHYLSGPARRHVGSQDLRFRNGTARLSMDETSM